MKRLFGLLILKIVGSLFDFLEGKNENEAAEWAAHFVPTGLRNRETEKF